MEAKMLVEKVAMISIVIVTVWRWAGYYMVMIIAGMLNVSTQYYEAASLEGATSWQKIQIYYIA